MTDRYERIRSALAMGPTPGPWAVNPVMAQVDAMPSTLPVCKLLWPTTKRTEEETWANGQLIAACDPDTIRALLADRDALASEIETLRSHNALLRGSVAQVERENDRLRQALEEMASAAPAAQPAASAEQVQALRDALRELEGREQRDEALLRQALEVLGRARQTAMEQTLKARIPECAEFAGIDQDLDFVVAALRERLGRTAGEVK